jgi:hypothetical protein
MRFRLRSLMILLTAGPPIGALGYQRFEAYQRRHRASEHLKQIGLSLQNYSGGNIFISLPPGARVRGAPWPVVEKPTDEASPSSECDREAAN